MLKSEAPPFEAKLDEFGIELDKLDVASLSEFVVSNSDTNGSKYVFKFRILPALASEVATTMKTIVPLLNMNN